MQRKSQVGNDTGAKEEAGIDIDENDIAFAHVMHRKSVEDGSIFSCCRKMKNEIANMEPHKCDDLRWFGMDNLPKIWFPMLKRPYQSIKRILNSTNSDGSERLLFSEISIICLNCEKINIKAIYDSRRDNKSLLKRKGRRRLRRF